MPKNPKKGRPYKAEGEGTELISLRINEQILAQLRAAAESAGHGRLSREINNRLARSLDRDRGAERSPGARGLCFLLAETTERLPSNMREFWRHDPFMYRAIRLAFIDVLDELAPTGEVRPPQWVERYLKHLRTVGGEANLKQADAFERRWKTPATLANHMAKGVLSDFGGAAAHPDDIRANFEARFGAEVLQTRAYKIHRRRWEQSYYGMEQARYDLAAKPKREGAARSRPRPARG